MAVALLGYFSTMVAAFAGLMFLLTTVLTSPMLQKSRPMPHLMPAVTETAAPEAQGELPRASVNNKAGGDVDANTAAAARTDEKKVKQRKLAAVAKRIEVVRQPQAQSYSLALGYNQDPPQSARPSLFNSFGPQRF